MQTMNTRFSEPLVNLINILLLAMLFLLLMGITTNAAAQSTPTVSDPDCGGFEEPPCDIFGDFSGFWFPNQGCDNGLQLVTTDILDPDDYYCSSDNRKTPEAGQFGQTWAGWALRQQRELGFDEPLNWVAGIKTHNAYNSINGGEALLNLLANQKYSITDQLRIGARWLELDFHFHEGRLKVCHGNDYGELDFDGLAAFFEDVLEIPVEDNTVITVFEDTGCVSFSRPFYNVIKEIRDWLNDNPDEIVMLSLYSYEEAEGEINRVVWPLETFLGDKILRTDEPFIDRNGTVHQAYQYFREDNTRMPTPAEMLFGFDDPKQVLIITHRQGNAIFSPWEWPETALSGGDVSKFMPSDVNGVCEGNGSIVTPMASNSDMAGRFRRVYEARSGTDPFSGDSEKVGFINDQIIDSIPLADPAFQTTVKDVVRCNLTLDFDYLYAQEAGPASVCNLVNPFYLGADCSEPDERLNAAVWSWKEGDKGDSCTGCDKALLDVDDGRWTSREGNEQHHFACAKPRSYLLDPSDWADIDGGEWEVTDAVGTWDKGLELCTEEFGNRNLVFMVPRNGWQNERLIDAWVRAAARPTFSNVNADIWLNYDDFTRSQGFSTWRVGRPPHVVMGPIVMDPMSVQVGDTVSFAIEQIINDLDIPLEVLTWKLLSGFVESGPGITLDSDPNNLFDNDPATTTSISFTFDERQLNSDTYNGSRDFTLIVGLIGDLSGFDDDLPVQAGIARKSIQFTVNDPPPAPPAIFASDEIRPGPQLYAVFQEPARLLQTYFFYNDAQGEADGPFTCTVEYIDVDLNQVRSTETSTSDDGTVNCLYDQGILLTDFYQTIGNFAVRITVTDKNGMSSEHVIDVFNTPVVPDPAPPRITGGCNDQTILLEESFGCSPMFSDENVTDPFVVTVNYGDGSGDQVLDVNASVFNTNFYVFLQHQYQSPGTYTVTVSVSDGTFDPVIAQYTVIVEELIVLTPPRIELIDDPATPEPGPQFSPVTGSQGVEISRRFRIIDTDHPATTRWRVFFNWEASLTQDNQETAGSFVVEKNAENPNAEYTLSHTYDKTGQFEVAQRISYSGTGSKRHVFDAYIATANTALLLDGLNLEPAILAEGDSLQRLNQSFTDPDNNTWTGTVDWGDNSAIESLVLSGQNFDLSHQYPKDDGSYTVTVVISDGEEIARGSFDVTVHNVAPSAIAGPDQTIMESETATFSGSVTDPGTLDTHIYQWDFGDANDTTPGTGQTPSHQFQDDGIYTVTLTVTDDDGGVGTDTLRLTVNNVAPSVDAGPDQQVLRNEAVNVSGSWTDPANIVDAPYAWNWTVDGSSGASGNANYGESASYSTSFSNAGSYELKLDVSDKDGATGSDSLLVEVINQAPDCSAATTSELSLWPPNNKFVAVEILGVTDPDGDPVAITIDAVMQDESVQPKAPDATGVGTSTVNLRAQRAGNGNGRVYHLSFSADDGQGDACSGEVLVTVPHDQSGSEAIDEGTLYDSTNS